MKILKEGFPNKKEKYIKQKEVNDDKIFSQLMKKIKNNPDYGIELVRY